MSWSHVKTAWGIEGLTSMQRLVLTCLAFNADSSGLIRLPVAQIYTQCGVAKASLFRSLSELEALRLIARKGENKSVTIGLTMRPYESHHETDGVSPRDRLSLTVRPMPPDESHSETDGAGKKKNPPHPLKEKAKVLLEVEGGASAPATAATLAKTDDFRGWPDISDCPVTRPEALAYGQRYGLDEAAIDEWWGYWQGKEWRQEGGEKMERRHVWRRFGNWKATAEAIKARKEQEAKNGGERKPSGGGKKPSNHADAGGAYDHLF